MVRSFARFALSLAPLTLVLAACSAETANDDPAASADEDAVRGTNCEATFVWLQKDAYKETAGRTSPLWPPHTTTTIEASCTTKANGKQPLASAFQANYGTEPGAKDKNGNVILVEVKRDTVRGSKTAISNLVAAYKTCGCDPKQFLGMDRLKGDVGEKLLTDVITSIEQASGLACTNEGGKAALVAALKAQDFEKAIAIAPKCSFEGGSLASTLDKALAEIARSTNQTFADYHVCNNNAALQAELFAGFKATSNVKACSAASTLCRGPKWLYNP